MVKFFEVLPSILATRWLPAPKSLSRARASMCFRTVELVCVEMIRIVRNLDSSFRGNGHIVNQTEKEVDPRSE